MSTPSVVEDIFFSALSKPNGSDRDAFLDHACQGDAEQRGRVERLLRAQPRAGVVLEHPGPALGQRSIPSQASPAAGVWGVRRSAR